MALFSMTKSALSLMPDVYLCLLSKSAAFLQFN
jgi:hypothetical protein